MTIAVNYRQRFIDPVERLRMLADQTQANIWTALPGIIKSFDASAITAQVQPAIRGRFRAPDGTWTAQTLPVCPDVPVHFQQGGGCLMTFPIAQGDECLLVFSSRCIDLWWAMGGVQPEYEQRTNNLSDAFAIVGVRNKTRAVSSISTTTAQLRSLDGANCVEVDPNGAIVTLKAASKVVIDTPIVSVTGSMQIAGDATFGYGTSNVTALGHKHATAEPGPPVSPTPNT